MNEAIAGRKRGLAASFAFAALLAAITAAAAASGSERDSKRVGIGQVFSATSGDGSEIERLLPISPRAGARERVVMSLGPGELPMLLSGDELLASAELQLSTTCVDRRSRRCIGRPYRFSPKLGARLVLAPDATSTGGEPISARDSKLCAQRRPNRNHHCVLVVKDGRKQVGAPTELPCQSGQCFVNVVASAWHRRARRGNVVAVGADTPSGRVRQDKGRVNAVVLRGSGLAADAGRVTERQQAAVPVATAGKDGRRVIYSLPLPDLRSGDAYLAQARQPMGIGHLRYNVFLGTRMVLASGPDDVVPSELARQTGRFAGQVTEANGFNCTQGPSGFKSPCSTRKAGLLQVERDAVDAGGNPVTLYLNLVVNASPRLRRARGRDDARALSGGFLEATRYRGPN